MSLYGVLVGEDGAVTTAIEMDLEEIRQSTEQAFDRALYELHKQRSGLLAALLRIDAVIAAIEGAREEIPG